METENATAVAGQEEGVFVDGRKESKEEVFVTADSPLPACCQTDKDDEEE